MIGAPMETTTMEIENESKRWIWKQQVWIGWKGQGIQNGNTSFKHTNIHIHSGEPFPESEISA